MFHFPLLFLFHLPSLLLFPLMFLSLAVNFYFPPGPPPGLHDGQERQLWKCIRKINLRCLFLPNLIPTLRQLNALESCVYVGSDRWTWDKTTSVLLWRQESDSYKVKGNTNCSREWENSQFGQQGRDMSGSRSLHHHFLYFRSDHKNGQKNLHFVRPGEDMSWIMIPGVGKDRYTGFHFASFLNIQAPSQVPGEGNFC